MKQTNEMNGFTPRLDREIAIGDKVKVFYNLNDKTFSIQKGTLVHGYSDIVRLENVTFKVSEVRRQRVLEKKVKNVHAYVVGTLVGFEAGPEEKAAYYNPYKVKTFIGEDSQPLHEAESATLINKQVKYA